MKVYIDFSIFDSPNGAFGNVTGYIELTKFPSIGDKILLLNDDLSKTLEFPGSLAVRTITPVTGYGPDKTVVGLEDVVVSSRGVAKNLGTKLESECGLFCVEYSEQ